MYSVQSLKLLGFGTAALIAGFAFTGGCSSSDNSARTGTGGTGTTTGGTGAGGTGTAGTLGTGGANATAGTSSGGTTPIGGTTGTAGSGAAGGTGVDVCGFPTTTAADPVIYDGATTAPNCGSSIKTVGTRLGFWFSYGDATTGAVKTAIGDKGGCAGANDCAFHTTGSGYDDYGAGIGFDLMDNSAQAAQPYDATPYTGLQFWVKGTISGTRGPAYADLPNELHTKLVTPTYRAGDEYGGYCMIGTDWTMCSLTFAQATRDGFADHTHIDPTTMAAAPDPATDTLNLNQLTKIQFEFSKLGVSMMPPSVTYDMWIDDVSFF